MELTLVEPRHRKWSTDFEIVHSIHGNRNALMHDAQCLFLIWTILNDLTFFLLLTRSCVCAPLTHFCLTVQVTDYQMAVQLAAEAINGPTTQGGLRPFSWQSFNHSTHQGLPHTYNFPFVTMRPTLRQPWQRTQTGETIRPCRTGHTFLLGFWKCLAKCDQHFPLCWSKMQFKCKGDLNSQTQYIIIIEN